MTPHTRVGRRRHTATPDTEATWTSAGKLSHVGVSRTPRAAAPTMRPETLRSWRATCGTMRAGGRRPLRQDAPLWCPQRSCARGGGPHDHWTSAACGLPYGFPSPVKDNTHDSRRDSPSHRETDGGNSGPELFQHEGRGGESPATPAAATGAPHPVSGIGALRHRGGEGRLGKRWRFDNPLRGLALRLRAVEHGMHAVYGQAEGSTRCDLWRVCRGFGEHMETPWCPRDPLTTLRFKCRQPLLRLSSIFVISQIYIHDIIAYQNTLYLGRHAPYACTTSGRLHPRQYGETSGP